MSEQANADVRLRDLQPIEALAWIEATASVEAGAGAERRTHDFPVVLPAAVIEAVEPLFQPRPFDEQHAMEIAAAIKAGRKIDPLLLYAIGGRFLLLDGHHRLAAYRHAKIAAAVPVEFFAGTPKDAVLAARARNSPTKKAMSKADRLDAAWALVKLDQHSKAAICEATLASKGSVDAMRKALKALGNEEAAECKTWWQARRRAEGKAGGKDMTEAECQTWREEQADRWADRLAKAFSTKMADNPEVAAMALERHFGRRTVALVQHLREYLPKKGEWEDDDEGDF